MVWISQPAGGVSTMEWCDRLLQTLLVSSCTNLTSFNTCYLHLKPKQVPETLPPSVLGQTGASNSALSPPEVPRQGETRGYTLLGAVSATLFWRSFKTLGQRPLLPASCYCLLCQCVEQPLPQPLQFQTCWVANPTLLKNGFCHPDLITQRFTHTAEVSVMALCLLCAPCTA